MRDWVCGYYQDRGIRVTPEQVLITSGSQQGLDLLARGLFDPGDPVYMNDPGYIGAIQAFQAAELVCQPWNFTSTPGSAPGNLYIVPNFANPTGESLPREVRRALLQSSHWIIADDPYGQISFCGPTSPWLPDIPIEDGPLILLGSGSKWLCPGLRIGWIVAPTPLIELLGRLKQAADLQTSTLSQFTFLELAGLLPPEEARDLLVPVYRQQRDAMVTALKRYWDDDGAFRTPQGGFFLWLTLPEGWSAGDFAARALERGVAVVPGTAFALDRSRPGHPGTIRLSYSKETPEMIDRAIARLAEIL